MAATSFLTGACKRALVAGVNLTLRAETTAVLSRAGMLAAVSSQTPCHTSCGHRPVLASIDKAHPFHSSSLVMSQPGDRLSCTRGGL